MDAAPPSRCRWGFLAAFSTLSTTNAMMWIQFAPVRAEAASYYGVDVGSIDLLSMVYMWSYFPAFLPCTWLLQSSGGNSLQRGLRIAAVLNLAAAALRWAAGPRFAVVLAGQILAATAQGFILPAPPRISMLMFPEAEWGLATGIGVLANQAGGGIAFVLASLLSQPGGGSASLPQLLRWNGGLVALSAVIVALFVGAVPATPPSVAAASRAADDTETTLVAFARQVLFPARVGDAPPPKCWSSRMALAVGYGLTIGAFYAFSTVLDALLPNMSASEVGAVGTAALVAGIPGALLGGLLCDMTKRYRGVNVALGLVAAASLGALATTANESGSVGQRLGLGGAIGLFLGGLLSSGMEWGNEVSYPAGEITTSGFVNCFSQIGGIALIYALEAVVRAHGPRTASACLAASCLLGTAVFAFGVGPELRRQEAARGHQHQGGGYDSIDGDKDADAERSSEIW